MTRDELAALEAAATPGPWACTEGGTMWDGRGWFLTDADAADAALIAAARNVLPELLRRLDLVEQALAAVLDEPDWGQLRYGPVEQWNEAAAREKAARARARDVLAAIRAPLDTDETT
jgi:hypothetical protein